MHPNILIPIPLTQDPLQYPVRDPVHDIRLIHFPLTLQSWLATGAPSKLTEARCLDFSLGIWSHSELLARSPAAAAAMAMASMSMALNRPLAPLQGQQQPSLRSRRSRAPAMTISCISSSSPSPKRSQQCAAPEELGRRRIGGVLVPVFTAAALIGECLGPHSQ